MQRIDRLSAQLRPSPCKALSAEAISERLSRDGVVVIRGVYTAEQIAAFRAQQDRQFAHLRKHAIKPELRREQDYLTALGRKVYGRQAFYVYEGTPCLELAEGRYDYTWGMDSGEFADPAFFSPEPVASVVKHQLSADFAHFAGALPTHSKSAPGPWHRDTYSLFEDDALQAQLPPFYLTMLVPLVPIREGNGPTEILIGSHRMTHDDAVERCERRLMTADPGDVVLFDGRCVHRGQANASSAERPLLYCVFHKKWYLDYMDGVDYAKFDPLPGSRDDRPVELR
jgi:ectoine hydroxylase-related dioxygenase (phytanoyl-CoA dioxygenase family)